MKNMKLDYTRINEDKLFINNCAPNCESKSDFEIFFHKQSVIETVKYPFLSKSQVRNRIMTIWKKKNVSSRRFHGKQDNVNKRNSKFESSISKSCRDMKTNHKFEGSLTKFPVKKNLVPLKVDFVSSSSSEAFKRNSPGTGVKRRVSFNKELYIRYRTTSEESSSSTLKCKRNKLKENFNKHCTQNFDPDEKFNKILNKCSWSYRSPKVRIKHKMEETKSLDDHDILWNEEPQNKCETVTDNKVREIKINMSKDNYLLSPVARDTKISEGSYLFIPDAHDIKTSEDNYLSILDETDAKVNMNENNYLHISDEIDIKVNMNEDNYLCTTGAKKNEICGMQKDNQDEDVNFGERKVYTKTIDEILNGESVSENIDEMVQLESTRVSSQTKYVNGTVNESAISGNSSSDEEVLQTRFSLQNKIYEDECNVAKTSDTFVSISDKESITENNSEIEKMPAMTQTQVDNKKKSIGNKTNDSNSALKQKKENKDHKVAIDISNHQSLNIEADNSNMDTESSYMKNSLINNNKDLPLNDRNDGSDILQEVSMENVVDEITFNQNIEEINDISNNFIIEDFFSGVLDTSIFKSEKISPMIKSEKGVTVENQLMKDRHSPSKQRKGNRNMHKSSNLYNSLNYNNKAEYKKINSNNKHFSNSTDDLDVHLKRKLTSKQTENSKKARITRVKNKNEVIDRTSEILNEDELKPKTRSESRGQKANSQYKPVKNQLKYNDKSTTDLNSFNNTKSNCKKVGTKSSMIRTNIHKKEKIFNDFSYKITPFKKARDSRNCSLIASKKINDMEKTKNSDSYEKIDLDLDSASFISNIEKNENNHESIFESGKTNQKFKTEFKLKNDKFCKDTESIASSDSFKFYVQKERNIKNNQKTRSKKKEFEDILDACQIKTKWQLKDKKSNSNFISETNSPDFLAEENENMYENYYSNRKKVSNTKKSKSNEKLENRLLEHSTSIENKVTSYKIGAINMNCGAITRAKKRTWEMLEKELLGKSNDSPLSDKVTETVLLKKQSIRRQNMKDGDHSISDKSIIQTVNKSAKGNKYDGKYEIQNIDSSCLQASTKNAKRDSNTFIKNIQSNKIVPYKSNNILEKAIAAMDKCTAKFIAPKVTFTKKEFIHSEVEFDRMINEISIDQQAEFHSNTTVMQNKNEQYYKNEIVAVLKQSNSKKNTRSAAKISYNDEKYKSDYDDAEHLVKRRIITKSYSVKSDAGENHKIKSQALIPTIGKKQTDPWTRLMEELNLDQNTENKSKNVLKCNPYTKPHICHENVKQTRNRYPNTDFEIYKQDETENEEREILEQATYEEMSVLPNHMVVNRDLNFEDNCYYSNDAESRRNKENAESSKEYATEKNKESKDFESKKKQQTFQNKRTSSPKFKLQIKEDGGVKFQRCNRSLSSSSDESEKQKEESTKYKFPQNKIVSKKQNYKKYLSDLFESADAKEDSKKFNNLIAKNEDDVFSISSSDSETVNKKKTGSGLLFDVFDE